MSRLAAVFSMKPAKARIEAQRLQSFYGPSTPCRPRERSLHDPSPGHQHKIPFCLRQPDDFEDDTLLTHTIKCNYSAEACGNSHRANITEAEPFLDEVDPQAFIADKVYNTAPHPASTLRARSEIRPTASPKQHLTICALCCAITDSRTDVASSSTCSTSL